MIQRIYFLQVQIFSLSNVLDFILPFIQLDALLSPKFDLLIKLIINLQLWPLI